MGLLINLTQIESLEWRALIWGNASIRSTCGMSAAYLLITNICGRAQKTINSAPSQANGHRFYKKANWTWASGGGGGKPGRSVPPLQLPLQLVTSLRELLLWFPSVMDYNLFDEIRQFLSKFLLVRIFTMEEGSITVTIKGFFFYFL